MTTAPKLLRVFCSYAHEDEEHLNELRRWLRGLERQGLIGMVHDREIAPGWEWEEAIDKNLRTADIILLLVTPDFMASDYVYEKEIDRAIERHEARVIPIIVRPSDWQWTHLNRLQALPKDAKPITTWPNRDEAWLDVLGGIRKAVKELLDERRERAAAKERYREAAEEAWADNELNGANVERLSTLASDLSLSGDAAADIEHNVLGTTKEAIIERQEQAAREEERKERLKGLYDRARELYQNQRWQAVLDVFAQIHSEDPTYPDDARLLQSTNGALKTQERARRVAAVYAEGQRHIDAREWPQALRCFEEVRRLKSDYRDVETLLSRARHEVSERTSEQADEPEEDQLQSAQHYSTSPAEEVHQPRSQVLQLFPAPHRLAWYLTTALASVPGIVLFGLSPSLESAGGTGAGSMFANLWLANFAFVYAITSIAAYKRPIDWRFAAAFTVLPHVPFLVTNFAYILEDFGAVTPMNVLITIGGTTGALAIFILPNALIVSTISYMRRRKRLDANT